MAVYINKPAPITATIMVGHGGRSYLHSIHAGLGHEGVEHDGLGHEGLGLFTAGAFVGTPLAETRFTLAGTMFVWTILTGSWMGTMLTGSTLTGVGLVGYRMAGVLFISKTGLSLNDTGRLICIGKLKLFYNWNIHPMIYIWKDWIWNDEVISFRMMFSWNYIMSNDGNIHRGMYIGREFF